MNLTRQRHHVLTWQNGWILTISYPMMLVFIFLGDAWNPAQQNVYALATVFVGLFLVMLASSFIVVRHAEKLAEYLGTEVEW